MLLERSEGRRPGRWWLLLLLALFPPAAAGATGGAFTATEQWVATQVKAGRAADLQRFPPTARVLGAQFVATLLAQPLASPDAQRRGVEIKGAVVRDTLDLDTAELRYDVQFVNCRFEREVKLSNAVFHRGLSFEGSHLHSANFENLKVGGALFLKGTQFHGAVNLIYANLGGSLEAENARFHSARDEASFVGLKVARQATFHQAQFDGPVNFRRATFAGNFDLGQARFRHAEDLSSGGGPRTPNVDCKGIMVGGDLFIDQAVFAGAADFRYAEVSGNLEAVKTKMLGDAARHEVSFRGIKARAVFLEQATLRGPVDLREANVQSLYLGQITWPRRRGAVRMAGTTYQYLSGGTGSDALAHLLRLANHAAYSADVYANLEQFFLRQGRADWATEVFVAQKRRERAEFLRGPAWVWSALLDLLVRHGRSPGRALLWSLVFVLAGAIVFRDAARMVAVESETPPTSYSGFWFSLDHFIPFVTLEATRAWMPQSHRRWAWLYLRLHVLAGWILMPIGLLALSGNLK